MPNHKGITISITGENMHSEFPEFPHPDNFEPNRAEKELTGNALETDLLCPVTSTHSSTISAYIPYMPGIYLVSST